MRAGAGEVFFFCLATGAAMGCLFLACKVLRLLLGLKKAGTALVDVLFCLICGAAVFLCALAVDQGRLRFYQAALQLAGFWAAVAALDPLVTKIAGGIRKFIRFLGAKMPRPKRKKPRKRKPLAGKGRPLRKKQQKTGKKPKKVQKSA